MNLEDRIDPKRVPRHIACVMDGNGRWAQQRGLKRTDGHQAGERALVDTVHAAVDMGVKWLTVYAFSTENWKRPPSEVRFLMHFNEDILLRRVDEFHARDVRIRFIGRRERPLPRRLLATMDRVEARTAGNRGLTLSIALNYGGRAELVDAVKKVIDDGVPSRKIDEKLISRYLYDAEMPDPDLMVRTSGEFRLSNFLTWELAYSELVFTDVLWPDFGRAELYRAVHEYQSRDRRFGGIAPAAPGGGDSDDVIDLTDGAEAPAPAPTGAPTAAPTGAPMGAGPVVAGLRAER